MSRHLAQQWIDAGAVTIDDRTATRAAARVAEGARVAIALPADTTLRTIPAPEDTPLDVLYEDEAILAVNKPPGLVVHPSYKQASGTMLNAVLWRIRHRPDAQPGILTRLDRDTSGVVVIALTPAIHAALQRDAAAGRIVKEYLALTCGAPHPPSGTIHAPLGRDPDDRRRVIVRPDGAESATIYERLADVTSGTLSLVRCQLITGRTHQIRVHLSSRGWPVLGDRVYGTPSDLIPRQALHAWRITLPHPVAGGTVRITAPVPPDMLAVDGETWAHHVTG
jgi:23S rRNA pseudouridine1911/1915/1917 synthase